MREAGTWERKVLGILSTCFFCCLTKEYKKKIRQEIYYIEKFGLESHTQRQGIADSVGYLTSLKGRIAFVLQTCPTDSEFLRYKNFLQGDRRIKERQNE